MPEIIIPYRARFPQTQIHPQIEKHRFNVLVTHRQMGKTVCAINHLIKMALKNPLPAARYFYIAPFRNQAKTLTWDYFKRFLAGLVRYKAVSFNESELSIQLTGKATIRVVGADNPDALRGNYADGIVLDEYGDIRPDVYTEIIRPMLISRKGWVLFMGTPKGRNQFYDVYRRAQEEYAKDPEGDWWAGCYRADETGVFPPEELEQIRQETAENIFNREYLCDFSTSAQDCVFSADMLLRAERNEFDFTGGERIAALDLARYGADNCVLAVWEYAGPMRWKEVAFEAWNGKEAMYTVGRVADASKQYRFNRLIVDGDGMGGPVIDRLKEVLSFQVSEFRGGFNANDNERFANKRAETYFALRDFLAKGYLDIKNKAALTELAMVTYSFNSKGQIKMFSKEDLKNKEGKSPDFADTVMMSAALFGTSFKANYRQSKRGNVLSAYDGFDF